MVDAVISTVEATISLVSAQRPILYGDLDQN